MRANFQTTLAERIDLMGRGVHGGAESRVSLLPAEPNTGIVFVKAGVAKGAVKNQRIKLSPEAVRNTDFATVLGDENGTLCSTVEHLLATFTGLGIDNVVVEVEGGEVPIFDGSSLAFIEAIDAVGIERQEAPRRYLKVLKPVRIAQGRASGELLPYDAGFRVEIEIDFNHSLIGHQRYAATLSPDTFRQDLAPARTFGFMSDVAKLWSAGYALGASLENTVCLGEDRVLNPGGLRFSDEFVRHKALDAVGDLALAGAPILGAFEGVKGGHALTNQLLRALFARADAWRWEPAAPRADAPAPLAATVIAAE
jgi:UDP-3-O-[3-hydroxymyristoyl] N-acetylglucosamine deacetylase